MAKTCTTERTLGDLMRANLHEYALYVTEDRAIPDIRDGLKPVQRRVLYTASRLAASDRDRR